MEWLIIFAVFGVTLLLGTLLKRSRPEEKAKRALRQQPIVPIAEVQQGQLVKVAGLLDFAEKALIAPLSKRPCAAWKVIVSQYSDSSWAEWFRDEAVSPFVIEDATGRALIRDPFAELALIADFTWSERSSVCHVCFSACGETAPKCRAPLLW
ncbi:MAG: hypothetical protein RBU37_15210 [Myxococcota bacterium]|jgi:hypothetical protein|nr:hypothetical protein [Myxococcota bacterium]